jgi:repressor LexA
MSRDYRPDGVGTDDELSRMRQADILEFIQTFWDENGYGPSFRDIMHGCGYRSTSSVSHQLAQLKDMGEIEYQPHIARSIRILEDWAK